MKDLRGFKKNYFTLAAIQAYSSAVSLHAREGAYLSAVTHFVLHDEQEEDPPDEPLVCGCAASKERDRSRPCHCNRFFRRLAWLLLHLSELLKRPPCRCRYTKTGLAPPFFE